MKSSNGAETQAQRDNIVIMESVRNYLNQTIRMCSAVNETTKCMQRLVGTQ